MSRRHDYSVPRLHQEAAMSLQEFADREGLTASQVLRCAKKGLILGARKDARTKRWTIYPPAKLLRRPQDCAQRRRGGEVLGATAALPNPLAGVDAVAVEARTKSRRLGQASPPVEAEGVQPLADQQAQRAEPPEASPRPDCAAALPLAYAAPEVQACCRALQAAAAKAAQAAAVKPATARPFVLTEEQRGHLAFAAFCQMDELYDSDEADHPYTQDVIRTLRETLHILEWGPI